MNPSRPARHLSARIPGMTVLLLLTALSVSTSTRAAEKDELASTGQRHCRCAASGVER
ncbi:hypothetical protein HQN64_18870 [Enterobacteriaceae bacterium BIT-l23]|uniref:hypothetical protein n=1 Tax=Jejubacter sp. L23 TaxID=3092086 RepID=UPI0015851158|nr:hypothetical protein [Enterobacteriaceae bacterium BIT-l23]